MPLDPAEYVVAPLTSLRKYVHMYGGELLLGADRGAKKNRLEIYQSKKEKEKKKTEVLSPYSIRIIRDKPAFKEATATHLPAARHQRQ